MIAERGWSRPQHDQLPDNELAVWSSPKHELPVPQMGLAVAGLAGTAGWPADLATARDLGSPPPLPPPAAAPL